MKKISIIKFTGITICITLLALSVFAQQKYWTAPPYKINMTSSTPTTTTLPPGGNALTPFNSTNGAYDEAGNLLFYVKNSGYYSANGTYLDLFGNWNNSGGISGQYGEISTEVSIVPIPGTCKEFYVIYSKQNNLSSFSVLLFEKVNCTGANPVITHSGFAGIPIMPEGFLIHSFSNTEMINFAVSKIYTGTGATSKRYLFYTTSAGIYRSEISATGITTGMQIVSTATLGLTALDMKSYEAELSWGNRKFAWCANGKAIVIGVNGLYQWDNTIQTFTIAGAKGLEFDNNTGASPFLYISGNAGLNKINLSTSVVSAIATPGYALDNTLLEYGANNKIYGVSPTYTGTTLTSTKLVGISIPANTVTNVSINIDSRFTTTPNTASYNYAQNVFTLNDQIDGEDYKLFAGQPNAGITNFTINSVVPGGDCDVVGGFMDVYNCNPILCNANVTGTPYQYKIDIVSVINCVPVNGAQYVNYSGVWTNGAPPPNIDLRTLTGANGKNLGNTTGYAQVTLSISNLCGTIKTYAKIINVKSAVSPSFSFGIYDYNNSQVYLLPSTNINAPCLAASTSIGFKISGSSGLITYITVQVDEVLPNQKNIFTKTTAINGAINYTYQNLNDYCVDQTVWNPFTGITACNGNTGWQSYFAWTNAQLSLNSTYKLTVTFGNPCGSYTAYSYIKVVIPRVGNNEIVDDVNQINFVTYPNPVTDRLQIEFDNPSMQAYNLKLYDITGRQAFILLNDNIINAGQQSFNFDVAALPKGMYFYKLVNNTGKLIGKLEKQ